MEYYTDRIENSYIENPNGKNGVLVITGMDPEGRPARIQHSHAGAQALNPAFDITPARLIRAIITERGIYAPDALPLDQPRQT